MDPTKVAYLLLLGTAVAVIALVLAEDVTVELSDGTLQGFTTEEDGKVINNFYGIPYASPPVGDLRFSPPGPAIPWSGVKDASTPGNSCWQGDEFWNRGREPSSEDCLYLNVHAPGDASSGDPVPVMVWVHGGSFRAGAGDLDNGARLAARGVIVVTLNYRLDVFGFLSTEDDVIPGNYGMLDQVAALKWVNENIAAFGGDPDQITLFGESAGAVSVSLLVMSPLTRGLFQGAIMESGVSLVFWGIAFPARTLTPALAAQQIGEIVGCTASNSKDLRSCFLAVDAEDLLNAALAVAGGNIIMNPRVEQSYGFLPDLPLDLLASGDFNHVNTIRGFNRHEYAIFLNLASLESTATQKSVTILVESVLGDFTIEGSEELEEEMLDQYLGDLDVTDSSAVAKAVEAVGTDLNFRGGLINEMDLASKASTGEQHYFYEFATRPENSYQPDWVTAGHTEEIPYVFGSVLDSSDGQQRAVSDSVMSMWVNFAKTGNPNNPDGTVATDGTQWKPVESSAQNMLSIQIDGNVLDQFGDPGVLEGYNEFLQEINTAVVPDVIG